MSNFSLFLFSLLFCFFFLYFILSFFFFFFIFFFFLFFFFKIIIFLQTPSLTIIKINADPIQLNQFSNTKTKVHYLSQYLIVIKRQYVHKSTNFEFPSILKKSTTPHYHSHYLEVLGEPKQKDKYSRKYNFLLTMITNRLIGFVSFSAQIHILHIFITITNNFIISIPYKTSQNYPKPLFSFAQVITTDTPKPHPNVNPNYFTQVRLYLSSKLKLLQNQLMLGYYFKEARNIQQQTQLTSSMQTFTQTQIKLITLYLHVQIIVESESFSFVDGALDYNKSSL
eukprot:TRINITY_DN5617_c0_g1_i1.p1 TRINITY_DN5617_c0_g1~~TRINITY_DN5617_c0_g1_i1.p1  ORF type:complete len:282 (+),score=-14.71 TRINITY_DN5617_c0_g1_i1:2-847(+)